MKNYFFSTNLKGEFDIFRRFILSKKNVGDTYIWNMVSNMLFAFQSVIILMLLTRFMSLEESGVFTIAYANACLFLLIGKYGVRNYQVSDVNSVYSFKEYRRVRQITVLLMAFAGICFIVFSQWKNGYSTEKSMIMMLAIVYKIPDALEDLYHGEYQRNGRLDVAAKCMSIRLMLAVVSLIVFSAIFKDLFIAFIVSDIISFVALKLLLSSTKELLSTEKNVSIEGKNIKKILLDCLPLFLGTFLLQYINNAPKYAIDSLMSDEVQACYGFISMPVFVTGIFSKIIYDASIKKMSVLWQDGNIELFKKNIYIQVIIIFGITICTIVGGWFLGIPVLSLLYNTDLSEYRKELIILLLVGGILAGASFLNVVLTIMRQQEKTIYAYIIAALVALLCSYDIIRAYGIFGAVMLYLLTTVILVVVFAIIVAFKFDYYKKKGA